MEFNSFKDLKAQYDPLKKKYRLHSLAEERLGAILQELYPGCYAHPEPGEIPGGRSDLAFYFPDGRYAIFEIFATVSQVAQDLRHLELSEAQAKIAILVDPELDGGKIYKEYFRKRPRSPFPWVNLSDLLVASREEEIRKQLKDHIDTALSQQRTADNKVVTPDLRLRVYNMGRDRSLKDEIFLSTNKAYPQIHIFGMGLLNLSESSVAQEILIRIEVSNRASIPNGSRGPVFRVPTGRGWRLQVEQLLEEQVAVLVYEDQGIPCFHGQPIEWDSFTVNLQDPIQGDLRLDYTVSSVSPFSEHKGILFIRLNAD